MTGLTLCYLFARRAGHVLPGTADPARRSLACVAPVKVPRCLSVPSDGVEINLPTPKSPPPLPSSLPLPPSPPQRPPGASYLFLIMHNVSLGLCAHSCPDSAKADNLRVVVENLSAKIREFYSVVFEQCFGLMNALQAELNGLGLTPRPERNDSALSAAGQAVQCKAFGSCTEEAS